MPEITTFANEINRAQHAAMSVDDSMMCFGLGIDDPKRIFGTTSHLTENFGHSRVFDMPTSENAMTGVGIGAAIAGSRVLMTHQRLDFFLLAMDQLVNNAAKWHYMFNGQMKVPLTIRLIIGRGWGQGPTHAQNLQAWFAHVPGLKVVVASRCENAANLLYQSIMDDNPVVFLEHRWLHNQQAEPADTKDMKLALQGTPSWRKGNDVTIVTNSYMTLEALRAAKILEQSGISCDIIDTNCLHQIDWDSLFESVKRTGHLLLCDSGRKAFSVSSEVSAFVTESCFAHLKKAPVRLGLPDYPEPTSFGLTKDFYIKADKIVSSVAQLLEKDVDYRPSSDGAHDVPGNWFKGPF